MTDRITQGEEFRAQKQREARVTEQRTCMRGMMTAMVDVLKLLYGMGVIAGEIERVAPDGNCAIVLIVDESPLAHPDRKKELERKLPFVSGIGVLRDHFLETARRRKVVLPFSFIIQDRSGKITRSDTVQ